MKLLLFPRTSRLHARSLFYLEQWTALLIGLVCLVVSARAAFTGSEGSLSGHHSWLSGTAFLMTKYSLTIAVAFIGTVLVRFAFYKPKPKNAAPAIHLEMQPPQKDRSGKEEKAQTG